MTTPRLRMFAGPNGSGKSTIKSVVPPELLGVYLNPDEIEKEIRDRDFLDLRAYGVETNREEILSFFAKSTLLAKAGLDDEAECLRFSDGKLSFFEVSRYARSLDLLLPAIRQSHRAYLFDNSRHGGERLWVAEITDGANLETKCSPLPLWFQRAVWDKISPPPLMA